jgi:hypothetical protein
LALRCEPHEGVLAAFFDSQARGRGDVGLDFVGKSAFGIAVLKRSKAAAVQRDVGIGGVGVETLTDHDDGFAMLVHALADEGDVSVEGGVTGDFFPYEVEGVGGEPHVFSAAGKGERFGRRVVGCGARVEDGADVGVIFEGAQVGLREGLN